MKKFICGVIAVAKEGVHVCYTVYDNNTGVMYYILSAPKFDAGSSAMSPIYDEYGNICTYDSDIH